MKIEITYDNREKYTDFIAYETYENVVACHMDDVPVSVLHNISTCVHYPPSSCDDLIG